MKDKRLSARKRFVFACVLILASSIIVVIAGEFIFDYMYCNHSFGGDTEMPWVRRDREDRSKNFTVDPDFGFRPILDKDYYFETGTLCNSYSLEKRPGVNRILFIGDSVTERARIIKALRSCYGDDGFEYWNAGVESFNTVQEVEFYRRYNRKIAPDHVILTLHNNDFRSTAVAFFDSQNQLVIYTPQTFIQDVNPWLFEHSYIYRLILGLRLKEEKDRSVIENEVKMALLELKILTKQDGAKLSVLIFPIMKSYQEWSPEEKENQKAALKILKELNIRHFDLQPISEQAIIDGVDVQEEEGDSWHPNDAVSVKFADFLQENNFLP